MTDDLTTLDGLQAAAWDRLERAAKDRTGPAHLMTFATQNADGPEARLLVLRAVDQANWTVQFWTNAASGKIANLAADNRATALFWDPDISLQVRLRLDVRVAQGPAEVWDKLPDHARANYRAAPLPSQEITAPEQAIGGGDIANFAALTCKIRQMECLHFAPDLHRRAVFTSAQGHWIAP